MKKKFTREEGFTLIEVLVVIGIIAILAAVVLIAINPARQFAQARNSQRTSNMETVLDAISERSVDNKGVLAGSFTVGSDTYVCPTLTAGTDYDIASTPGTSTIDLSCLVPTYVSVQLPVDPSATGAQWTDATNYDTQYHVLVDANGRYTVSAPSAELGATISLTR